MKKSTLIVLAVIAFILGACSPAQIASGTYNGTISAYGFPISSGSATMTITQIDANTVSISIISSGNPDMNVSGINVTKLDIPYGTYLTFSGSVNMLSIDGNYVEAGGINECYIDMDSTGTSSSAYISFSGSK